MQTIRTLCGIDVSAKALAARKRREGAADEEKEFTNDASGHGQLIKWLGRQARVCLEATGVYHLQLALALVRARVEVMVVNPRVAKDYAGSLGRRSKTDRVDAAVLLDFVQRMEFVPWQEPRAAVLELRELSRRVSELVQTRTNEKNRLHARKASASSRAVVADLQAHIAQLDKRILAVERAAVEVIKSDSDLNEQFKLLSQARGFGPRTAMQLIAELAVLDPTMTVREIVAHAGLDPRSYESGTSVERKVRISKVGNARIRAILYMNAISAIRHARGARLFSAQLIARGKKRMQAVVAVMRKLLHGIWIVLQRRVAFDSRLLFAASLAKAESSDSAVAAIQPEMSEGHPKGRSEAEELRQQLESRSSEAKPRKRTIAA
jgi:transposase